MPGPSLSSALAAAGLRPDGTAFGTLEAEHAAVRGAVGIAPRARALTRVAGRDAERFLQGQLSNDVTAIPHGGAREALLLTAKARVVADLRVLRLGDDAFLLDCDPAAAPALRATLVRYRLAAKATIEDLDDAWGMVLVAGPRAGMALLDACGVLPRAAAAEGEGLDVPVGEAVLHGVATPLVGEKAFDVIGPDADVAAAFEALVAAAARHGGGAVGPAALELLRIEAGMPRFGHEVDEQVMPAEAGLVERAVSFTKGCYVGQEPVARLHYRGHANRGLRALLLDGAVPPPGAEVVLGDRPVGRVTSAAASLSLARPIALALLRREVDDGARIAVRWDGGEGAGEVAALPPYRWRAG